MKKRKIIPYIFLTSLLAIIIFMLGLRHGQSVEKTNKQIDFILSITPTKKIEPSPLPTITFSVFTHENCEISFIKPSYLVVKKESSTGALLDSSMNEKINIDCIDSKKITQSNDQKNATISSILLNNQKVTGTKREIDTDFIELTFANSKKQLTYTFIIHKNIYPIFERTFTFLP